MANVGSGKCYMCKNQIGSQEVHCYSCKQDYHHSCAALTSNTYQRMSQQKKSEWKCKSCREKKNERSASQSSMEMKSTQDGEGRETENANTDEYASQPTMLTLHLQIKALSTDINEIKNSVKFLSDKYDELLSMNKKLEESTKKNNDKIQKLTEKNQTQQKLLEDLELKVESLELNSRKQNIELHGVEQQDNENMVQLINKIQNMLDLQQNELHIEAAHRIPSRNYSKPKPIILRFNSINTKEIWMTAKRGKTITNDDIYGNGNLSRIYFNDNLTTFKKDLFWKTRTKAKEKHYKYTWTKNNVILIRKDETSGIIKINHLSDLDKII